MNPTTFNKLSRRTFLAMSAAAPLAYSTLATSAIPVGLELYSVRDTLAKDLMGTVRAVAKMGYQCVEFYAPYYEWSVSQAKDVRKLLDDVGMKCYSTHNDSGFFQPEKLDHAKELNLILGCHYMIMASSHAGGRLDGWKVVADTLNQTADLLAPAGLKVGYHNHQTEFTPIDGTRPIEIIAKETKPTVALQLDVGTCINAGSDPVAWIKANPGRIKSIHCKEWSPDPAKEYKVLFGEGVAKWKDIFAAAESVGGVEYYLVEQEGSRYSELETAERCLKAFRATHG